MTKSVDIETTNRQQNHVKLIRQINRRRVASVWQKLPRGLIFVSAVSMRVHHFRLIKQCSKRILSPIHDWCICCFLFC